MTPREKTVGFAYFARLSPVAFSLLFEALFLSPDEWRRRLRLGRRDSARLFRPLRAYRDPMTRKKCFRGLDVRAALDACAESPETSK